MNVLAANDQENLVHALHTAAAGKSLNAGLKPANKAPKTPFKVPLNDENTVFKGGKSGVKTGIKLDNAFVTPAGPRSRAPLGMKTTNAKSRAFQTPAPLSGTIKTQKLSPRLRRPKVKVHQPEPEEVEEEHVPEVEYMPPKEVPLPDDLEDDMEPINWEFPMFKGSNMMRGAYSKYHNPIEDDGRTRGQRELEESLAKSQKKANEDFDRQFEDIMAKEDAETKRYLGLEESPKKPAPQAKLLVKKRTIPAVSTIKARSAASALTSVAPRPRSTAPIAVAKSRVPVSGLIGSRKPIARTPLNPSVSRNATAAAASKSTIGYAQGRATSTGSGPLPPAARKPLSNISRPLPSSTISTMRSRPGTASSNHSRAASAAGTASASIRHPRTRTPLSRCNSTSTDATLVAREPEVYRTAEDVEREMALLSLHDEADEDVDAWMDNFRSQVEGHPADEQYEDFQLELPAGF